MLRNLILMILLFCRTLLSCLEADISVKIDFTKKSAIISYQCLNSSDALYSAKVRNRKNTARYLDRHVYTMIGPESEKKSYLCHCSWSQCSFLLWKQHQTLKICFDNCGGNINIFQLNTIRPPLGPASTSQYLWSAESKAINKAVSFVNMANCVIKDKSPCDLTFYASRILHN